MEIEKRKIRYRTPARVVACSETVKDADVLLSEKELQIGLYEKHCLQISGRGFLILDFGEEIAGGIRILVHRSLTGEEEYQFPARIRFGESLSECCSELGEKGSCNDHSLRDFEVSLPFLSDQCYGDTGFRFVRIDFLSEKPFQIKAIVAKEWYRDLKCLKQYSGEDPMLARIFEACKRTVTLNIQNKIWDGIKRDRLVWLGDMEPEIHAILHLYGNIEEIEETVSFAEKNNPMPGWMNGIPSYSLWYLLICYDVFRIAKDEAFVRRHLDYMNKIIRQIDESFGNSGEFGYENIKDAPSDFYFIDWPSNDVDQQEKKGAHVNLTIIVMRKLDEMYEALGEDRKTILSIIEKATAVRQPIPSYKQFAALHYLAFHDDASYERLIEGKGEGMSTFLSYYTLTAIADRDPKLAEEVLKQYYGAMLEKGATTFWEDFDLSWMHGSCRIDEFPKAGQKDIHGDFGSNCYKGFRKSLCHGWSCGPISYLLERE